MAPIPQLVASTAAQIPLTSKITDFADIKITDYISNNPLNDTFTLVYNGGAIEGYAKAVSHWNDGIEEIHCNNYNIATKSDISREELRNELYKFLMKCYRQEWDFIVEVLRWALLVFLAIGIVLMSISIIYNCYMIVAEYRQSKREPIKLKLSEKEERALEWEKSMNISEKEGLVSITAPKKLSLLEKVIDLMWL